MHSLIIANQFGSFNNTHIHKYQDLNNGHDNPPKSQKQRTINNLIINIHKLCVSFESYKKL
jgi:hypothetical protein